MEQVIVYGKRDCNYCKLSVKFLEQRKISYKYIYIQENLTDFLNKKSKETDNTRTIPLIFIDNNFIGGYMNLLEYKFKSI